jgi:hypothetical protein
MHITQLSGKSPRGTPFQPSSSPALFQRPRPAGADTEGMEGVKSQLTYKPGSVGPLARRGDHSSVAPVTRALVQPTRTTWPRNRLGFPASSLFGLAPGGVYRAAPVARRPVRSYRTLSPLPIRRPAVCFLWHFPWGRPRRLLAVTVFRWSPDFPLAEGYPTASGHPVNWPASCAGRRVCSQVSNGCALGFVIA